MYLMNRRANDVVVFKLALTGVTTQYVLKKNKSTKTDEWAEQTLATVKALRGCEEGSRFCFELI